MLLTTGCTSTGTGTPASGAPGTTSGSAPGTTAAPTATSKPLQATYGAKACTLLTTDEVAPLLGYAPVAVATTPANFLGGGYTSACDFRHPDDPERKGKTIRVLVFPPLSSVDGARRAVTNDRDVTALDVPAFVGRAPEESGSGPNTIMVNVPDQSFSITVVTGADRDDTDVIALAKLALPRFQAVPHGPGATPAV